ncbi:RraA family protein [uncultured Maribacter sp.]|uniref:RraA family protein n=1 Tax=uncultured Maribacter sp. TaxID=431308 RepID=UPI00262CD74F|nr:RraA family protein [uncultured Maribacter sp.]
MKELEKERSLFKVVKEELFTAVIGDIMDKMGYRHQFLPPQIQPLRDDMVVAGRAMTVLEADTFENVTPNSPNQVMRNDFGLMLEALDDLKENEIYICTGASPTYALWGELMSTRAMVLKAAGAVVNGYSRDTKGILELGFPIFSYGRYAQDQGPRGKVIDFRCPIKIEGVMINDGDIVVGDLDGVCIIPKEIEEKVIDGALEKVRGEKKVAKAIQGGMSARESWDTYGIM